MGKIIIVFTIGMILLFVYFMYGYFPAPIQLIVHNDATISTTCTYGTSARARILQSDRSLEIYAIQNASDSLKTIFPYAQRTQVEVLAWCIQQGKDSRNLPTDNYIKVLYRPSKSHMFDNVQNITVNYPESACLDNNIDTSTVTVITAKGTYPCIVHKVITYP